MGVSKQGYNNFKGIDWEGVNKTAALSLVVSALAAEINEITEGEKKWL